jgi:nucleotide-binding universal stress UspA family protein
MLEKALQETDPGTTSTIVMTAKVLPVGSERTDLEELDQYDRELMTAVVTLAERIGKEVKPLIVPTNNPLHAVLATARDLHANELVMGASNVYTADAQMEQIAFYWINLHSGNPKPLTVRILSRERDVYLDLAGGNRIPKISERRARSVAELRAAGVGVDRVMLLHDGTAASSDLFNAVLTMLDPQVALTLVSVVPPGKDLLSGYNTVQQDKKRAEQLERRLALMQVSSPDGETIVKHACKEQIDLIILPIPPESPTDPLGHLDERSRYVATNAHCRVMLTTQPGIPTEVVDETPSAKSR